MTIRSSVEAARKCGYRKPGGYYLVAPALTEPCPLLPLPLDRCPHCGQGIGPARGFTWITPAILFPAQRHGSNEHNYNCPLGLPPHDLLLALGATGTDIDTYHRTGDRAGLIWVGGLYYKTPEDFMQEAAEMGVSRRVRRPPRGFKVGEHWIYLGHAKAIHHEPEPGLAVQLDPYDSPGIITLFRPTAIEYIVTGEESDEEIEALEERGITPVKVIRDVDAVLRYE